jgi:PAS domain S-box-containing protein
MSTDSGWDLIRPEHRTFLGPGIVIGSTLASILVSIWCLQAGYTIIFQNLLYIPIILACVQYIRKGFFFSCLLALGYFILMAGFTRDSTILIQAFIRVLIFVAVATVITLLASSLKKTERSLCQANRFNASIIDNARVWLMVLDRNGIVEVWNTAAEEMSGYPSRDVIGNPEIWKWLYPDHLYRKQITDTIRKGIEEDNFFEDFETVIKTRDGNEKIISWNTKGLVDDSKDTKYIAIGSDVTATHAITDELEGQRRFLQTLMDSMPVPVFYKNREGIYTGCNTEFEKYTGKPRDEIIGRSVYDLWPKNMADIYYNADAVVLESAQTQQYEASAPYADGNVHEVVFYKAPYYDDKGRVIGLIGAFLDITERKSSEKAIRKSEKQYRSLFENMLEGFAYCRMLYDAYGTPIDWIYLDVNDAFKRHTGISDAKGRVATEIFPGIRERSPELFELYNSVVVTGIPQDFEMFFIPLNIWLHISVYRPMEGHFIAVFENITPRKSAEQRLQTTIRELQIIIQNVPVMITLMDTDLRILKVNSAMARIIGRPVQEIEGRTLSELLPGNPENLIKNSLDVIRSKESRTGVLEEYTTPEGENIWVQTDTVPLLDEDKNVTGALVVSTDITGTKLAKDAISKVNHKLNLLSGITRHDIGNELQIVFGYVGLAEEQNQDPVVKEYLSHIGESAQHIKRQIAFTRDYQDIGVYSPAWQDVREVITRAILSIDVKPIQVFSEIAGVEIYSDPLIGKVFFNLIDNAKRYGETISQIRFSGYEADNEYHIICEDDGVGISEEFKVKIFNREYYKHTGFGLNLSREILDITGITIRETGTEGKGARFEILVPKGKFRFYPADEK